MEHQSAVLFDLDGTLTDPLEGIARSIQHTLVQLGALVPSQSELAYYIGPPLRRTFALLLQTSDPQIIEEAMRLYRERFVETGMFENKLYDGIVDVLAHLQGVACRLFVATGKPRIYAERILEYFGLTPFFEGVYGAELDGRFDNKVELIEHLLRQQHLPASATTMIGDRREDILAARANGVRAIGVSYGYGTDGELREAGADIICSSPRELLALFQREV